MDVRSAKQKEPITLHIGHYPRFLNRAKKPEFDLRRFFWDKAQFILVSVFVFVISYLLLNYQAISENVKFKIGGWGGDMEVQRALEQTKSYSKPLQASALIEKNSDELVFSAKIPIPRLNSPVYPPDTRIIIPRIMKNIPVVGVNNENLISRKWEELEKDIQEALRNGIVHYPGTALPGEIGNAVFTGHSSYYAWDAGRFKDVFALLHEMKIGDKVYVTHNQKKYTYEVFDIRVVKPIEIDVLGKTNDERLTLITCTPLGTNLKRLVVTARRLRP